MNFKKLKGSAFDKVQRQVAKCVTECKSQAAEAKKAVQSLTKTKKKRFQVGAGSAGEPDEGLDSNDDWSSDEFDTGDDDEDEEDRDYSNNITEVAFSVSDFGSDNSSANGPESVASSEGSGQYNEVTLEIRSSNMPGRTGVWNLSGPSSRRELDTTSTRPSVVLKSMSPLASDGSSSPPPASSPVSPAMNSRPARSPKAKAPTPSPNGVEKISANNSNGVTRRFIQKVQRPHSLPPAPPPPRNRLEPETPVVIEERCWEYEIPNSGIPESQSPPMGERPMSGQQEVIKVLPSAPLPPLRHRNNRALAGDGLHRAHADRRSLQETVQDFSSGTYEHIDKNEEGNYETVEDDNLTVQSRGREPTPASKPFVPPRKPAPLPPHLLAPCPPKSAQTDFRPALPGSSPEVAPTPPPPPPPIQFADVPGSRKSMSLLINEFRSKLGDQLERKAGSERAGTDSWPSSPTHTDKSPKLVNGSSLFMTSNGRVDATEPSRFSHSLPMLPSSDVPEYENDESLSIAVRPLPPVPFGQERLRRDDLGQQQQKRRKEEDLSHLPYYANVERGEAEQRLLSIGQEDAYLVRPSRRGGSDNPYTLTLIHKSRPFHLNIRLRPDGLYALGRKKEHEVVFGSVSALVSHHQQYPIYLSAQGVTVGTSLLRWHP